MNTTINLPDPPMPPDGCEWKEEGWGFETNEEVLRTYYSLNLGVWATPSTATCSGSDRSYYLVAVKKDAPKIPLSMISQNDYFCLVSSNGNMLINPPVMVDKYCNVLRIGKWKTEDIINANTRWSNTIPCSFEDATPFT